MSKEVKVALFVIVVAVIFILGLNFLKGKGFSTPTTPIMLFSIKWMVYIPPDPIIMLGYQVGKMGQLVLIGLRE
ncbi:MAG: hypothetical protein R2772_04000 [Chitinophagales bacterium]